MSCAYRRTVVRAAALAGVSPDDLATAMDAVQRLPRTPKTLPPEEQARWAAALGLSASCRSATTALTRLRDGLCLLCQARPTDARLARWVALAALLGAPTDRLPAPPVPAVLATLRQQRDTPAPDTLPPPAPIPDRVVLQEVGLTYLRAGQPIPPAWVEAVVQQRDRATAVAWLAGGAFHSHLEALCDDRLTRDQAITLLRAGVVPDSLVLVLGQRKEWLGDVGWIAVPPSAWDRVDAPDVARIGRERTRHAIDRYLRTPIATNEALLAEATRRPERAAELLIWFPDCTDDRLIAAVAREPYAAERVLVARPDLHDDRLMVAVAQDPYAAARVLRHRRDLRDPRLITAIARSAQASAEVLDARRDLTDDRLLAAAARDSQQAAWVLIVRSDLRDDRLVAAVAQQPDAAVWVLCETTRTDDRLIVAVAQQPYAAERVLSKTTRTDDRLIVAVAQDPTGAARVLIARPDLRDDRLIAAAAQHSWWAAEVLVTRRDLCDDRLIAAAAQDPQRAAEVLVRRRDLCDDRLIAAVAQQPRVVARVRRHRADLRDHPLFRATM